VRVRGGREKVRGERRWLDSWCRERAQASRALKAMSRRPSRTAIREGLEEMLGSRLGGGLLHDAQQLREGAQRLSRASSQSRSSSYRSLRQNFKEASPKYEERIAELLRERLRRWGSRTKS
jgi:histidine ammonia-lyase